MEKCIILTSVKVYQDSFLLRWPNNHRVDGAHCRDFQVRHFVCLHARARTQVDNWIWLAETWIIATTGLMIFHAMCTESGHNEIQWNCCAQCCRSRIWFYFWNIARNVARNNFNSGHTVQFTHCVQYCTQCCIVQPALRLDPDAKGLLVRVHSGRVRWGGGGGGHRVQSVLQTEVTRSTAKYWKTLFTKVF